MSDLIQDFEIFDDPGPVREYQNFQICGGQSLVRASKIFPGHGPKFQFFAGPGPIRSEVSNSCWSRSSQIFSVNVGAGPRFFKFFLD